MKPDMSKLYNALNMRTRRIAGCVSRAARILDLARGMDDATRRHNSYLKETRELIVRLKQRTKDEEALLEQDK